MKPYFLDWNQCDGDAAGTSSLWMGADWGWVTVVWVLMGLCQFVCSAVQGGWWSPESIFPAIKKILP